jgi:hypothetical protein
MMHNSHNALALLVWNRCCEGGLCSFSRAEKRPEFLLKNLQMLLLKCAGRASGTFLKGRKHFIAGRLAAFCLAVAVQP